jgi:hypothetical protein
MHKKLRSISLSGKAVYSDSADAGTIQQLIATARSVNVPEEIITMLSSDT